MGKDKKKKGLGMAKTMEKTKAKELKALKKELGEDDIDQLLSEIKKKDAEQVQIAILPCEPPTPRSGATLIAHPTKQEIILFGGELYNGRTTSVYNDLLVVRIKGTHRTAQPHTRETRIHLTAIATQMYAHFSLSLSPFPLSSCSTTFLRRSGRR